MKLSAPQKNVIKLMREGYEIRLDFINASVTLHCVQSAKITFPTFFKLSDLKLIEKTPGQREDSRPFIYRLTTLGESINID